MSSSLWAVPTTVSVLQVLPSAMVRLLRVLTIVFVRSFRVSFSFGFELIWAISQELNA